MSSLTTTSPGRADGRAALLGAAWAELAEHGPAGLSLRAVARRADVSHAAPKHHFGDRAGLLTALAVEGFAELRDRFQAVIDAGGPDRTRTLTRLGAAYLDFCLTRPDMYEVMYGTEPRHEQDPDLVEGRRRVWAQFSGMVLGAGPDVAATGADLPTPLMVWSLVRGLVALVHEGSLQRVAGVDSPAATVDIAHSLLHDFTEILRPVLTEALPPG
jgi:AcrR family transcriptional regulator